MSYWVCPTCLEWMERWYNHLNPNILKEAWKVEENRQIFEPHIESGNIWVEIAKVLPGRTGSTIQKSLEFFNENK